MEEKTMKNLPDSYDAKIAPMNFFAYLLYSTYGTESDNKIVNDYLANTHKIILEMNKRKAPFSDKPIQGFEMMRDYNSSGKFESFDLQNTASIISMAIYMASVSGIDLAGLNGPVSITKNEQNIIIKWLADTASGTSAAELRQSINVTNYILAHILMLLSKEIRPLPLRNSCAAKK